MAKDKSTTKKAPKAEKMTADKKAAGKAAKASKPAKPAKVADKAVVGDSPYRVADLLNLSDEHLLEAVQRQTFRYFWEGAEPFSGMARDRTTRTVDTANDLVTTGGTGFGIMAMIVAVERGWITRDECLARLAKI